MTDREKARMQSLEAALSRYRAKRAELVGQLTSMQCAADKLSAELATLRLKLFQESRHHE